MKRKALAIALVLCMVLSMVPMTAFAAQPAPQRGVMTPGAVGTLSTAAVTPNASSYSVTLTSSGKGEAQLLVSSPAQAGSEVYFLANPDDGYLAEVYYEGLSDDALVYVGMDVIGFIMPANKVKLDVRFVPAEGSSHSIEVIENGGSGDYVLTRTSAKEYESILLAVKPENNNRFDPENNLWVIGAPAFYLFEEEGIHYYEIIMSTENVQIYLCYERTGPYTVTPKLYGDPNGGTVTVSPQKAYPNDLVTVTITPNADCRVSDITCMEELTKVQENVYTFIMPNRAVDVHVTFQRVYNPLTLTVLTGLGGSAQLSHTKAKAGETITLTCAPQEGYRVAQITGVSKLTDNGDNTYTFPMPDSAVKLEVLFLRNENPFLDVNETQFFYAPVLWAVENGITNGASADLFAPFVECNRAQVVTFLWRYAGSPEPSTTEHPFTDVPAGGWYEKPVLWALENGITNGISASEFGSNLTCNRAQVVTFLWRMMKEPAPGLTEQPFTDVDKGIWFEKPVLWALEKGITTGTSATTFNPNGQCQRAQVVTFLYRTAQLAPTPAVYAVSTQFDAAMGTVTLSHEEAAAGEVITAIVTPAEGYMLDWVQCGSDIEITVVSETEFTFVMPDHEEVFYAGFAPIETDPVEEIQTYELDLRTNGNGEVSYVGDRMAAPGESIFFYAVPEEGYFLERVGIFNPDNAIDVSQIRLYEHEDNLYELVMINHDIIMTLYFSPIG